MPKERAFSLGDPQESHQIIDFEPIGDELQVKADWISPSGEAAGVHRNELLDPTLRKKCLSAFQMMKKDGWLETTNIEKQLHVGNLVKVLNFYKVHLDSNSPEMLESQWSFS